MKLTTIFIAAPMEGTYLAVINRLPAVLSTSM